MAFATLLSRITGFIRTVMISSALGGTVASAFNTANQLPNMVTEIVLGSVLTALVVPVLVRAEKEDPDQGAAFIRRLFTLTVTLLGVVTLIAVLSAPLLTRLMLKDEGKVNVFQATSFAYLLLPQIIFYGLFSLFMAVLNTKEVFRPGAWAPVANNIISITVMALYLFLPGQIDAAEATPITDPHVLLLGLGTTFGVAVQCLIMLPALRRLNIDLRPLWGIDDRLKQFGGMAAAIVAYVGISQVGYMINSRIASAVDGSAPTIYMQHWQLLQVPYGIIGVTLLTAIMPRLSRNAADGDDKAVVRDLTMGAKLTFLALIPIIVFMTALGPDIGTALFRYGNFSEQDAHTLGMTVSFSAFTLLPYALVMLHLRVFYAREEAWTPTFIIFGITLTKVVLASLAPLVASKPSQVVVLLGAANGFGFVAGAAIGSFLLRRKLGSLNTMSVVRTGAWAAAASLVGIAAALLARYLLGLLPVGIPGSIGLLIEVGVLGAIFLIVTGIVLSQSKLPEVTSLGSALARIPGMGRFFRTDPDADEPMIPVDVQTQFLGHDTFNTSPVPPPMSAGVVRGPRLVPGAAVSDGRFRLLRDHGASIGARFWQAREQETGRTVALTFVDTCGAAPMAAVSPRQAAIDAAGIAYRTARLSELRLPAVAEVIETIPYRTGCVIVSEWIPGSSLQAITEAGQPLLEQAVADALIPLEEALTVAHGNGTPLGMDNRNRMRVTEDGTVVLAFPAVLPDATIEDDEAAFTSAGDLLRNLVSERGTTALSVAEEPGTNSGDMPKVRGFGERGAGAAGTAVIVATAIAVVVAVASLGAFVLGKFSNDPESPVTSDSVRDGTDALGPFALPTSISPLLTEAYGGSYIPDAANLSQDSQQPVELEVGDQVLITAADQSLIEPQQVIVVAAAGGLDYTISGVLASNPYAPPTELKKGSLTTGRQSIDIPDQPRVTGLVLTITEPAVPRGNTTGVVSLREISLVGKRVEDSAH